MIVRILAYHWKFDRKPLHLFCPFGHNQYDIRIVGTEGQRSVLEPLLELCP